MKRVDLEHILRASKALTGETEFIVIGSQSILGRYPDAPRELRQSMEADLYPRFRPDLAALIEGSLGELSTFEQTHGFLADGVGPETAVLPAGWEKRLIRLENSNTDGAIGWCLDPVDLAFSKLAARRAKDLDFVRAMLRLKLIRRSALVALIDDVEQSNLREQLAEALAVCQRR